MSLDNDQFLALTRANEDSAPKEQAQKRKEYEEKIQQYLDQASLNARYNYWAKMPFWTNQEAQAIFAGIEPRLMEKRNMPLAAKYGLLLRLANHAEIFKRAVYSYELDNSEPPKKYIDWANNKGIKVPDALAKLMSKPTPKTTTIKEKPLGTRERETLLKLIISMATDKYGYDQKATKNGGVTRVKNAAERTGFKISDDTIRNKLKEAEKYLSPEYADDL